MQLTQEQIEFLNKVCGGRENGVKWRLTSDGEVDVYGWVDMRNMNLTEIPVKFGTVNERFNCGNNKLTTLKNCPNFIHNLIEFYNNPLTEYFKNIKEEDFPHWDKLRYTLTLDEYPFLINIISKYLGDDLKWYVDNVPQTKLYLK
jgi:hypothetical protein